MPAETTQKSLHADIKPFEKIKVERFDQLISKVVKDFHSKYAKKKKEKQVDVKFETPQPTKSVFIAPQKSRVHLKTSGNFLDQ